MQHILVYADSLSWSIIPTTRRRLPFEQRWPGIIENELVTQSQRTQLISDLYKLDLQHPWLSALV